MLMHCDSVIGYTLQTSYGHLCGAFYGTVRDQTDVLPVSNPSVKMKLE